MPDPLPDPFEFMKKLWNPMGLPMPGMVTPTLDLDAVEKKIADLKSVENWLNLNLNMLRLTIQGLEMQKNTLGMMKGMQHAPADAAAQANPFADPGAWWSMMQTAAASAAAAKPAETKPAEAKPAEVPPAGAKPAQAAPAKAKPK